MARITIDGLQSLLNFMSVRALIPEKFHDTPLLDFVQIDVIPVHNEEKRPMPVQTSPLSSMP
jgi:hypothetical protein